MSILGKKGRPGWDKAPPEVELEIRSVWQEDEMPDEIKNDPGYRPFTLGLDAQTWVDSMEEVVDGGDAVYGRPRRIEAVHHQSLATPSSSTPPPPYQQPAPPPPLAPPIFAARVEPYQPHTTMPDIDAPPASAQRQRTLPRRVVMPDIGDEINAVTAPSRPPMPDIEGHSAPARRSIPDIDETPAAPPPTAMPDITGAPARGGSSSIPDIGDEASPNRPSIPDIGGDDDAPATGPSPGAMPDIGTD